MALTDVQKVRLRVGDYSDLEYLPDSVYQEVLDENNGKIVVSSSIIANYILAMLTRRTRSKLAQIESYDNQEFENYKSFLILTVSNPAFMPYSPIPFGGGTAEDNPLIQFQTLWNNGYIEGTSYDEMLMWSNSSNSSNLFSV